jgi:WD40 repeat protein
MMKLSQPHEMGQNSKYLNKSDSSSGEGTTLIKIEQKLPDQPKKDPVAYELNFEEPKKPKRDLQSASVAVTAKPNEVDDEEDGNYSSDFESYESDFEAEPESSEETSTEDEIPPKDRIDSGSFDMSAKKSATQSIAQYDSIDDTVNSHDSGISYDDTKARQMSPRVSNFYRRGEELMKKITFDSMTFEIYEQKPIPYEVFMSVYGQRGMTQACTQSDSLAVCEECQTEKIIKSNMWTQNPPKFTSRGLEMINSKIYNEEKIGCGEENFEDHEMRKESDDYDLSIDAINNFSQNEFKAAISRPPNTLELNKFLQNASITISNIIEGKSNRKELQSSKIPISRGFFSIKFKEIEILSETIVTKIYTNLSLNNFLISTHKKDFHNFMCLWSIANPSIPIKIFSAWSDIKCLEIHPQMKDVIIGGCNDGTICLWDIQEINEFKGDLDVTMPFGIISLNQVQNDFALDNVCALKSLPHREFSSNSSMFQAKSASQICSLHENGTLSIWTLLNVDIEELETGKKEFFLIMFTYKNLCENVLKVRSPY